MTHLRAILCMAGTVLAMTAALGATMTFEEIGVPIKDVPIGGRSVGPDATGKLNTLYINHGQEGGRFFLVALNVETGEVKQYPGPVLEPHAYASALGSDGRIYLGTCESGGYILRFDPKTEEFISLGHGSPSETYIWTLSATSDGKVYGGTYGSAKLVEVDCQTGAVTDLGRLSETEQYSRFTYYGEADHTVYAEINTVDNHIAAYLRDTGEKRRVSFPGWEGAGYPSPYEGEDGYVYARGQDKVWRLVRGQGEPVAEAPAKRVQRLWDGRVVSSIVPGRVTLSLPGTDHIWEIPYSYDCDGSGLFVVREGPLGRIYGSSAIPLRVFEYRPDTGSLVNLGNPTGTDGEVYSFAHKDGLLYIAAYGGAYLTVYDPVRPYHYGTQVESNPRGLGGIGDAQCRPHAMQVGFDGKIWIASISTYGQLGGAITRLTPGTYEKRIWRNIVPEQSPITLAMDPAQGLIWSSTTVTGGGGTTPTAKEAVLLAFDPVTEQKVFECVPVPGAQWLEALEMGSNGLLYGTAGKTLYVFDPVKREVVASGELPAGIHYEALQLGEEGWLYAMAGDSFVRISPRDHSVEVLGSYPGASCGFALVGKDIYFGKGATLCVGHIEE